MHNMHMHMPDGHAMFHHQNRASSQHGHQTLAPTVSMMSHTFSTFSKVWVG